MSELWDSATETRLLIYPLSKLFLTLWLCAAAFDIPCDIMRQLCYIVFKQY